MSKIYKDIFFNDNFLVLSGPSFAYEIAKGLPAAQTQSYR
jgi:glycerol-3-phosphate dehydrogenase